MDGFACSISELFREVLEQPRLGTYTCKKEEHFDEFIKLSFHGRIRDSSRSLTKYVSRNPKEDTQLPLVH